MGQPQISVIIPVYQMTKHLNNCLQSIIEQTKVDSEILILNATGETLQTREDSSAKVLDVTVANLWETALESASADYITFVAPTDYLLADSLAVLYSEAQKNGSDLVRGCLLEHYEEAQQERRKKRYLYEDVHSELSGVKLNPANRKTLLLADAASTIRGFLYKKELLKNNEIICVNNIFDAEVYIATMALIYSDKYSVAEIDTYCFRAYYDKKAVLARAEQQYLLVEAAQQRDLMEKYGDVIEIIFIKNSFLFSNRLEVNLSREERLKIKDLKKEAEQIFPMYTKNEHYKAVFGNKEQQVSKKIKTMLSLSKKKSFASTDLYKNMVRIFPYVRRYSVRAVMAILITIPIGSLDALIALALRPYTDLVMIEHSLPAWYLPLGIIAFTTIQGVCEYASAYLNTWVGGKMTNDLKRDLYNKMLSFETGFFDTYKSGDVIMRFNSDPDAACSGLLNNFKVFATRFFSSIALLGVLLYNSWQLSLIAMAVLGWTFFLFGGIKKKIHALTVKSIQSSGEIVTACNETFAGNKTIAAYNLQDYQSSKFAELLQNLFKLQMKMVQKVRWLTPMLHILTSVGIAGALGFGAYLLSSGQMTAGSFVSFLTALIMLYTPLKGIGGTVTSLQMSSMAIERVFDLLEREPMVKDIETPLHLNNRKADIEFKDVSFYYQEDIPVLKDINFKVSAGETVAFVGNSGGGKTSLVNLIPRFYDATSGSILVDGQDIRNYSLHSLRDKIAVVFQDNFLFSGTIRQNILLGNENATEEEISRAVKMAFLEDFIDELPQGLETEIGERGMRLSGGQKQRVAIARAFLKNASIIILDEATSALDNKAEAVVQMAIDSLMKDRTVFVIAHRLSTIQNADKIIVINEGNLAEIGKHEELLKHDGAYKNLYEAQFKKAQKKETVVEE